MSGMQSPDVTRYSVESGRHEIKKERWGLTLGWLLVAGACVVIAVFAYLLLSGGVV
jgi:hypothetical protein